MRQSYASGMPWMPRILLEAVFALVLGATLNRYIPDLLPYGWLAILVILTAEILHTKTSRNWFLRVYSQWGVRHLVPSYVIVAILGASLLCFYWWGIGKAFSLLEQQKTAAQGLKAEIPPPASQPLAVTQPQLPLNEKPSAVLESKPRLTKEVPTQHKDKVPPVDAKAQEIQRRYEVLTRLRDEYVLTRTGVSAGLLERKEYPPPEWINQRLRELGETWRFEDKDKMYRLSKYEAMTNQELQDETLKFIAELRGFNNQKRMEDRIASDRLWNERVNAPKEKQNELWQKQGTEYTARHSSLEAEYNLRFRGTALSLRAELRKRVPELAKTLESGPNRQKILLDYGMFAGVDPVGDAADYIDQLARGLPVK